MLLQGCADLCSDEVVSQTFDPEQKSVAIHVVKGCGATTGDAHQVFIVAPGNSYDEVNRVFIADKVNNLTLTWLGERTLEISYDSARIFNFKNFWQSSEVDSYQYVVKVELRERAL